MSKFLEGLNPSQREAVTHEAGPLLIIAGPGSGKTRTVVHSIAYAIENGVMPEQILAFSFTVKASEELQDRVEEIVGEEKGYLVNISTFHSFCRQVLKEDIDKLGRGYARNFRALEENDQRKIVKNLARINEQRVRAEIEHIQSYKFPNPDEVLNFIKKCKAREISPLDAGPYAHEFHRSKDYIKIYESYEQLLKTNGWIDYESQQLFTEELFRNVPEVKTKWQNKFELIFVDEYQDTDPIQYRIVKTLAESHQNLRVVGDDDQGIYGWRGADIQNILNFEKNYPKAKVISLGQNYRSTQKIVEISHALAEFNPDRRDKDLFTRNFEGEKVKYLHCDNDEEEAATIASFIQRSINQGNWQPRDFAVLYRTNKQAYAFKTAFSDLGIQYHIVGDSLDVPTIGISIMTIHKSKGLEFPNVFVTGICQDLLPHYYNSDEKDWGEELRLLYVAMTRAKNWLCLSSYEEEGKFQRKRGRSPFLERGYIPSSLLESVETLESVLIPPSPPEMTVPVTGETAEYIEPLPEKLLGDGMTVLGIDPGIQNVGWSITKKSPVGYTVLRYGTQTTTGWQNTIVQTESTINKLITLHHPDAIAVEKLDGATEEWFRYVAGCVATIKNIAAQHGIECHLYTPQHVKYAATGNRSAYKLDVQKAVKRMCNLQEIPEPHHSADAIATSLCYLRSYLNSSRFEGDKRKQERYKAGCDYLDKKQYETAIDTFKEAINIDPIYADAHCGLGRAYLGLDKLEEAENLANEVLRLDENYQLARPLLGDIKQAHVNRSKDYLNQGNLAAAEESTNEALRLDKNYLPARELRETIRKLYCNQGLDYIADRAFDKAVKSLQKAKDIDPNDKAVWSNLGLAYYLIDEYVNAASCYRKVTDLDPKDKNAYSNLGNAYFLMGAYSDAIEPLQKACALDPNCGKFHYYLGRAQFELDRLGEAKWAVKKALESNQVHHPTIKLLKKIEKRSHEIIRRGNPDMILIPAGEFQMGCGDRDAPSNEKPIHTVYLDDFYIDKYPVTNIQYKRFVDANPRWHKDSVPRKYHNGGYLKHWNGNNYPSGKANHPVVHVSWYAAVAYAQWVGKRLPTEAEWEKAARGGLVSQIYPWGNSIDSSNANYSRNVRQTTPVGDYPANNYGLYDMAGNVWEWCLDIYNEDFYVKSPCRNPFAGGTLKNLTDFFRNVKSSRVLRGGSCSVEPQDVRCTTRTWKSPDIPCPDLGFRCVMTPTP